MTYESVSRIAQQGGSVYFLVLFLIAVAYALWPRRKDDFQRMARLPLEEDDHP